MKCPYCASDLPEVQPHTCPSCGRNLALATGSEAQQSEHAPAPSLLPAVRVNWPIFFTVLFSPPLLTLLVARGGRQTEGLAIATALIGGGLASLVCGVWLGRRLGSTVATRVALGVICVGMLSFVCIGMSCFGCLAGGFKMDFR